MGFLREPLVHFLVLGGLLFVAYAYEQRGRSGPEPSHEVRLTLDDLKQMELYFESQWHRPPTQEEFDAMVENKAEEEILYREGVAMGLDKDDTIVKRRMVQKMQFLAEDVATAHEPSTSELKDWFEKNSDKFTLPSRISFRHLFFSYDKRGQNAQIDALKALEKLKGQPENSPVTANIADPFMFQDYYADRTPVALAKEFGPGFATGVYRLKQGSWQGPIESGFGWHLVWVENLVPGRVPAFEEIEPDVKTAWLGYEKQKAWEDAYKKIRKKYRIYLPAPPKDGAAPPPEPPKKRPDARRAEDALPL